VAAPRHPVDARVDRQTVRVVERAASSTAVLVCQGRASADGRYAVGLFSDPVARELLDPADRALVDRVRAGLVPDGARERVAYEMVRRTGLTMVPRTVAIDRAIRDHAAEQVVLLGAGLDARAWRMPELARASVFEVDHAASQQDKLRRVGRRTPTAGRLVPVAVDLASERLGPPLTHAGFDRQVATTWVWEGVVPYLSAEQVRSTVAQVAELSAPGSRLVVNYQRKSLAVGIARVAVRLAFRATRQPDPLATEPWRSAWRPDRMRSMVEDHGFDVAWDSDLLALSTGLGLPADSKASLRNGRVAVAVRR
jgi:methyltransferase (TIGR00027 family)